MGIAITLLMIVGIGIFSGSRVKNTGDFMTGGRRANAWIVSGVIMGSLVSGQATIGTAQLAFSYGLSACWFTLGAGLGCFVLAIVYAVPLRRTENDTLVSVISSEYGIKTGYFAVVLSSVGMFVSIIAQILSACALFTSVLPLSLLDAALLAIFLMAVYVIFGGAWGAGLGGIIKLALLYIASVSGCLLVLDLSGGTAGLLENISVLLLQSDLKEISGTANIAEIYHRYVNILARGAMKDIGSAFSLLIGVLSTQTYAQAIWSAKSDSSAKKGALLSAFMIPPIGIACIMIGLFMRGHYMTTAEMNDLLASGLTVPEGIGEIASAAQVFPVFVMNHMPKFFGGIVLGTLFITIVGGGAGLSLGIATTIVRDIFGKIAPEIIKGKKQLVIIRSTIIVILLMAMAITMMVPGAIINDFGFLSMGLRGTVIIFPISGALFLKKRIAAGWVLAGIIIGPATLLIGNFVSLSFDALFLGLLASMICMGFGWLCGRVRKLP